MNIKNIGKLVIKHIAATRSLVIGLLMLSVAACSESERPTIYIAKQIITMDESKPLAQAAVVQDGIIRFVGDLSSAKQSHPNAVIDETLAEHVIVPGFIDPHVHMILGAMIYSRPFVPPWDMPTPNGLAKGLPDKAALLDRLKQLDAELEDDEPLIAYGYHNLIQGDLNRHDLDQVSTTRPILIWHYSGHDFYLNSKALDWADVTLELEDEFEGIGIDDRGELSGRIYEDASMHLFTKLAPHVLTPGNIGDGFSGFENMLAEAGVTAVAELGYGLFNQTLEDSYYFLEYTKSDPYKLFLVPEHRAFSKKYGDDAAQEIVQLASEKADRGDPQVLRQVKFFTDAAFYSQTMRLESPGYLAGQSKGELGLWVTESNALVDAIAPYWRLGLDARIHSNGDAAQTATLNAMSEIRSTHPKLKQRFVIEHAGLLMPDHLQKLSELKGGVSAASHYVYLMGDDYKAALGSKIENLTPLASASGLNIPVTLHSDAPLAPPYPLQAAAVHMTRETRNGNVSTAGEALSAYQALKAITLDAAWAMGLEKSIGSIEVGKQANFTVLNQNPLGLPAKDWPQIKVWGVILDGEQYPLPPVTTPK